MKAIDVEIIELTKEISNLEIIERLESRHEIIKNQVAEKKLYQNKHQRYSGRYAIEIRKEGIIDLLIYKNYQTKEVLQIKIVYPNDK
jgi:hypothetical protein